MEGYIKAWWNNEAEDNARLSKVAAPYHSVPYREPWRGRQDEPDEWEFRYKLLGIINNVALVHGRTNYLSPGYHREGIKVSNL